MSDEAWFKMLALSCALHLLVIGLLTVTMKSKHKRIDLSGSYAVNLVGSVGKMGDGGGEKRSLPGEQVEKAKPKPVPVAKEEKKPVPAVKERPVREKPRPVKEEKNLRSLTKSKTPPKETVKEGTTKEELDRLNARIRNIRKKTEYVDIVKSGGSSGGSGTGAGASSGLLGTGEGVAGGTALDPLQQKYYLEVMEKIKNVWRVPTAAKKGMETAVVVKIRKDGMLLDITVDKRSGNRSYDESVMRAVRAAEPYPRIPTAMNADSLEIPFAFRPEDAL